MATIVETREMREPFARTFQATGESAVSWPAILGGAAASAALSLILLALGTGLGLSSISPYSYEGASAKTLGAGAIIWLLLMSGIASGVGGYIAGRLRTRWRDADADETHFRDSAHGFLAWAVATVVTAAVLTSAASSMVGTAARVGAGVAATAGAGVAAAGSGAMVEAAPSGADRYFVDMMFRGSKSAESGVDGNAQRDEAGAILANALKGDLTQADRTYLAQIVADRTGLAPAEAEQRVTQVVTNARNAAETAKAKAKEAAEAARKITAYTALWIFVSLLAGAFYAALAATWGGKQRDGVPH